MRKLFMVALCGAIAGLVAFGRPSSVAHAQPPRVVVGGPTQQVTFVSIDVETTVDAPLSHIDGYTAVNNYYVTVTIDYGATGAGFVVKGYIYDENAAQTVSLNFGTAANPVTSITTTGAGTGSVTGVFAIPVNSTWGQAITNGTFDTAWVTATIQNAAVIVDDDGAWLDTYMVRPAVNGGGGPVGGDLP